MKRQDPSEQQGSKKFKWSPEDSSTIHRPPATAAGARPAAQGLASSTSFPPLSASVPGPDATAALASYYAYYYPHFFAPATTAVYPDAKLYSMPLTHPSLAGPHAYGYAAQPFSQAHSHPHPHLPLVAPHSAAPAGRAIYLGNIPPSVTFEDIFNLIHHGTVDAVRRLMEKNCAFIDFVDPQAAATFLADYTARGLTLFGQTVKVSYATGSSMSNPAVTLALSSGGSRVLYLCPLLPTHSQPSPPVLLPSTEYLNSEWLRKSLSSFGEIESVKILPEKKTSFVYFTSILAAVSAVAALSGDPKWQGLKVGYGKDRCAPTVLTPLSSVGPAHALANASAITNLPAVTIHAGPTLPGVPVPFTSDHRTLFLGSLPPATMLSDLANAIRGGSLYNLKILEEKHCAFVTFVDAEAAYAFFDAAVGSAGVFAPDVQASSSFNTNINVTGVAVHGRRITKIGFSKPFPLSLGVADMIQHNRATRTLYLTPTLMSGSSRELPPMAEIRALFEPFGPLESVNVIPGKNVMFINYANLLSAVKALAALKDAGKGKWRLYYGRDRSAAALVPLRHRDARQSASKSDRIQSSASDALQDADGDMCHDNGLDAADAEARQKDKRQQAHGRTEKKTDNEQDSALQPSFEDLETLIELENALTTVQST